MQGKLAYNDDTKRFGILVSDLFENNGLNCGESLEVFLDGEWKTDRIEMYAGKYYLVHSRLKGIELEGLKVRK